MGQPGCGQVSAAGGSLAAGGLPACSRGLGCPLRVGSVAFVGVLRHQAAAAQEVRRAVASLASGLAVRSAADGPAELSAGVRLTTQELAVRQARRNARTVSDLLDIADAGLASVGDLLLRMRDLAIQAGSPVLTEEDRSALATAWTDLVQQLRQVVGSTTYNGMGLLDGTFTPAVRTRTYTQTVVVDPGQPASVTVQPGANRGAGGIAVSGTPLADATYRVTILTDAVFLEPSTSIAPQPKKGRIGVGPGSWPTTDTVYEVTIYRVRGERRYQVTDTDGQVVADDAIVQDLPVALPNGAVIRFVDKPNDYPVGAVYTVTTTAAVSEPAWYEIEAPSGTWTGSVSLEPVELGNGLTLRFDRPGEHLAYLAGDTFTIVVTAERPPVTEERTVTENVATGRPLVLQVGGRPGTEFRLTLPEVTPEALGIAELSLPAPESVGQALAALDRAAGQVHSGRAAIGALYNVLERLEARLGVYELNLQQAASQVVDADVALEASRLAGALARLRLSASVWRAYTTAFRESLAGLVLSTTDARGPALTLLSRAWQA